MTSLLVTNDFPPKVGGIQSYLYELWRRLPTADTTVLTTSYPGAPEFDAAQPFRIERRRSRVLLPSAGLARDVDALAREVGADVVFLDPMLPLGLIAPRLHAARIVLVAHGAEITMPARLPGTAQLARAALNAVVGVVAAGEYPARQVTAAAGRSMPVMVVPPGVDVDRFRPVTEAERADTRRRFGLDPARPLVLGVSRLVPRKGFDVLVDAVGALDPSVQLAIGGTGRDHRRLVHRAQSLGERARLLGRVPEDALAPLVSAADVFAMLCRDRWAGLEAEGYGIVFNEAAACGVAAVAGRSGGSHEAVVDGETGFVVPPRDVRATRDALARLLGDDALRERMGAAARQRAVDELSYDRLAERLAPVARGDFSTLRPLAEG